MRTIDYCGVIPLFEPVDGEAGLDSESFDISKAAHADIVLQFGAVTGDAVLTLYCGATAGAKTTALPFKYRLSSADFKAANADQLAASDTADADGIVTLTAATYDHRLLAIMLDGAEVPDDKPWITVELSAAASVLLVAGLALLTQPRYQPPVTAV